MNSFIKTIILVLIVFNLSAQKRISIFGKKNFIFTHLQFNAPIYSGSFKPVNYYVKNDEMKQKRVLLDKSITLSYNRIISSNLSLGLDAKIYSFKVPSSNKIIVSNGNETITQTDTFDFQMNSLGMTNISFIPYFEITNLKNHSPLGIVNQIGIGYSITYFKHKNYDYSMKRASSDVWLTPDTYSYNDKGPSYKAISIMYGQLLKLPLSKRLFLGMGVKYYLNFFLKNKDHKMNHPIVNYYDTYFYLKEKRILSIQGNIGLGFSF